MDSKASTSKMTRFPAATTLIALAVLALVGCSEKRKPARTSLPAQPPAVVATLPPIPPKAPLTSPPGLPEGVRVYNDLSYSMTGFAIGGASALESIHRRILASLASTGQRAVEYCDLGKEPKPKCGLKPDPARYRDRMNYKGLTSPLATVLEVPAPDPAIAAQPKAAVEGERLTVIITDGLESGSPLMNTSQPGTAIPGPNVYRIRDAFSARIGDGFGAWLIAISIPFNGRVIPERGLGQELFRRAQDHLKTVAADPIYAGLKIEARDLVREQSDKTEHYQYLGPRPVLIMVLTRDIPLGRQFVDSLRDGLNEERVPQPLGRIASVEVAPSDTQSFVFSGLSSSPVHGERTAFLRITERRENDTFVGRYECRGAATARIQLNAAQASKGVVALPAGLKQTLEASIVSAGAPAGLLTEPRFLGRGAFEMTLECARLTADTTLVIELRSAVVAGDPNKGWWSAWSAPNSYEMPERVFGLTDFIGGVVGAQVSPPRPQDRLRIVVAKKG